MSILRLIVASLTHHWRVNVAVALGVIAATAVLTGALLVGDSVRGSLAHLTLDRLGRIDEVLVTDRFFHAGLADQLAKSVEFQRRFDVALPVILLEATLETPDHSARAGKVNVLAAEDRFWKLGENGPARLPKGDEVVLNEPLAKQLGVTLGDELLLRIGQTSQIPADSPLGRKTETVRTRRLTVIAVVPAEGLGRFGLRPNQQLPYNAYVLVETLQAALEQPKKVNGLVVARKSEAGVPTVVDDEALQESLKPTLADLGYRLGPTKLGYVQLTSDRMLLEPAAEKAIDASFPAVTKQPAITYLANAIATGGHEIPYSTITGIDFAQEPPLGPFVTTDGQKAGALADDEIALNAWAAEDLGAKVGDQVDVTYFEPESTHGNVRQRTESFTLRAILAMDGAAADRDLTPELPGVTDQASIADWNPPFPFVASRVRKKDEQYWDDYRTTPKAFVSLATGRRLWSSRFGQTTSIRLAPPADIPIDNFVQQLKMNPESFGFTFLPIKRLGLMAAGGTTPFNLLFLGFSFFLITAALMLVALLMRLGIERRASEIGVLLAVGLSRKQVARALLGEGILTAGLAGLLGVGVGVGYAWLMLAGLRTWWLGAVTTPFLRLYVTPVSIIVGYALGVLMCFLAMAWTLVRMRRVPARRLLAGEASAAASFAAKGSAWGRIGGWITIALAVCLGLVASRLGGEAQAGAFFGSGFLVLAGLLSLLWFRLRAGGTGVGITTGDFPLYHLALRNGARNPSRSALTVGLVAAASFLIVAISAFRLDPLAEGIGKNSGSGGYALIGESDQPIYQNFGTKAGREELGFDVAEGAEEETALAEATVESLRVRTGDDASCLNLYQPRQPRVLGAPAGLIARGGFAWAGSAAQTTDERDNPWRLLEKPLPARPDGIARIPVVLDLNTALYSLHLWKGVGEQLDIDDGRGGKVHLQVVGLLKNSIFQGDLLLSEADFLRHFPQVSGYRYFLIDSGKGSETETRHLLEQRLGDYGFDAERSVDRLTSLLAVQNTYLSTFQSLGGLGLLLGTFGLATVQLRSVLERRGELALLRAAGFRRARIAGLVMIENGLLLIGGLGVGVLAALVAVLPHLFFGGASIPWLSLAGTLATVMIVGLLAGLAAVRASLNADLLPALRGE